MGPPTCDAVCARRNVQSAVTDSVEVATLPESTSPKERASASFPTFIFLRLMGVIYFIAFLSAAQQVVPLLGTHGLLPATRYLQVASEQLSDSNLWLTVPTVMWFNQSDIALQAICYLGIVASLFVLIGFGTGFALLACYLLYLSIVSVGQAFLSYQWDWLLLEAGFAALWVSPWFDLPGKNSSLPRPRLMPVWLLRTIIFKLMLMSGLAKLLSGDPTWANLSAMTFHYQTQPLPTPIGYFAHHLPVWFQKLSTLIMFGIELGAPVLIFFGRRGRAIAAVLFVLLQVMIALTGNYTFFNILAMVLCIPLLDDATTIKLVHSKAATKVVPERIKAWFDGQSTTIRATSSRTSIVLGYILNTIATVIIAMNLRTMTGTQIGLIDDLWRATSSFGISNSYGLFAVMTTERNEIIIEGSNDNKTWLAYELPFQAGNPKRMPPIVAPLQPRLDWQMWFASLSSYEQEPWFGHLIFRMLTGEKPVLALFSKNPFPDQPPKYIRASKYRYQFSSINDLLQNGDWWTREYVGPYFPTASINAQ